MNTQLTFAHTIAQIVQTAFNGGALQFDKLEVMGITVKMQIFTHFEQLSFQFEGKLLSISMYNTDSEDTQFDSIKATIIDLVK